MNIREISPAPRCDGPGFDLAGPFELLDWPSGPRDVISARDHAAALAIHLPFTTEESGFGA